MTLVDTWVDNHVVPGDRHLTKVRLRYFAAVPSIDVVGLLDRLSTGFGMAAAPDPILYWMGPVTQLQLRAAYDGTQVYDALSYMVTGPGALTGQQLQQFWTAVLGGRGGSEVVVEILRSLAGGNNTPAQIATCVRSFTDGAQRMTLSKEELRDALRDLRQAHLGAGQILALCTYLQTHLPAGIMAAAVAGQRFVRFCRDIANGPPINLATFLPFVRVHPSLTDAQFARLLLQLGFHPLHALLSAALPGGVNVPGGGLDTAEGMIGYAVGRQSIAAVADCLAEAFAANLTTDLLFKWLAHLQHMPAGNRVDRVATCIRLASAGRSAGRRNHPWGEVETLFDNLTADGRHNNDPNNVPGAAPVNVGRVRCTGERIRYFMRAHSYAYLDFTILNRTRDDITFFPAGTAVANVRNAVNNTLQQVTDQDVDDALAAAAAHILTVNQYEIGLIPDLGGGGNAALVHFMPFTLNPAHYWHKDLLTALGNLY